MLHEYYVQSEVTILHLDGGSSSVEELKDIVTLFFKIGTRTLSQGCTTIWLFFLFLYPLPFLISNCLNPPFGT